MSPKAEPARRSARANLAGRAGRLAEDVVHLPDIEFVQYNLEHYGLNRGVYNTIDGWFFEQGFIDIVLRRKLILMFLQSVYADGLAVRPERGRERMHFGKGGLTDRLLSFLDGHVRQRSLSLTGDGAASMQRNI